MTEDEKKAEAAAIAEQHRKALDAAIAYEQKAPAIRKRQRAQAEANTPEAIRKRNDWDPFTGE